MTTVLSDAAALESWRPRWEEMPLTHVDADLDHFRAVLRADPAVVGPRVVVVRGESGPVLVVARLVNITHGLTRHPAGRVRARTLLVSFGGILGASGGEDLVAARTAVQELLDAGEADLAIWQKVPTNADLAVALTGTGARRTFTRTPCSWWEADLPESWEALLAQRSSKSRRQIRYDDNKLRRRLDGRMELRTLDSVQQWSRLSADLSTVATRSYQDGVGVSVVHDRTQWQLVRSAAADGSLRIWMLYIDDSPVAFWWGIVRRGVLTVGTPGYDPAYARDRIGYFTFRRMLENACADPTIERVDFGPGDADYKARFGTRSTTVADVVQYARRPRARLAAASIRSHDAFVATLRNLARQLGRTNELRRSWRTRGRRSRDAGAVAPGGDRCERPQAR